MTPAETDAISKLSGTQLVAFKLLNAKVDLLASIVEVQQTTIKHLVDSINELNGWNKIHREYHDLRDKHTTA